MTGQRIEANTRTLAISNVGGAVLSFALSALIGRTLGEGGLGVYAVSLAWIYPVSLLVEFGLGTLLTRDAADDPALANAYLRQMVVQRLVVGGAAMLALILLAPLVSADPVVQRGVILSAPMVILLPFFSTFSAVYRAYGDMRPIPYLNIGMLLAQVTLTVGVFLLGGGVLAALAVNTLTSAGQLAAAWWVWKRRFTARSERQGEGIPRKDAPPRLLAGFFGLLRAAFPFALAGFFAALQLRLTTILLDSLASSAETGFLTAASRFTEAAKLLPNALFGALLPALAALAADPTGMRQVFRQSMIRLALYGVAAGLALGVSAPLLLRLIYGERFDPAVPSLAILAAGLLPALLRGGRTLYFYAYHREGYVNWVNAAAIPVQIGIGLALIPRLGAAGGALALVTSDAVALALLLRSPRRRKGDDSA